MAKSKKREEKNMTVNSKELIQDLVDLLKDKKYKKRLPYPKFNIQELRFIRDLIFHKPKGLVFFYLADHLMNNTTLRDLPMFNAPSMRKLRFIYNFLSSKSAKEAAIRAGYSQKTAKQQASRTLKEINGYKRPS
ncbi:terminase small subunit [bacterium]|nr:terminase small subunit [bacterium]